MSAKPIRFDGRVALVTGAGNGLGRDYALELARRGAKLVVNDLGTDTRGNLLPPGESPAEKVVAEIRDAGGEAVACHESCATRGGGTAIVQTALDAFGKLDIFIHNAGFLRNAAFDDQTDEQIDAILDVHLKAGFYVGQPAFQAMKENGYGRILLTSSASAFFGMPWQANYAAAKLGLAGLTNVLAIEGHRHAINVNGLLPAGSGRLGNPDSSDWPEEDFDITVDPDIGMIFPAMQNSFVTPMVLWLVSEQCDITQSFYSATAGRYSKVFMGATKGWLSDHANAPSPEDIATHMAEIDDTECFSRPLSVHDELADIVRHRKASGAG